MLGFDCPQISTQIKSLQKMLDNNGDIRKCLQILLSRKLHVYAIKKT
jgi:hypothetical protein